LHHEISYSPYNDLYRCDDCSLSAFKSLIYLLGSFGEHGIHFHPIFKSCDFSRPETFLCDFSHTCGVGISGYSP
ncbi:MAG: hypothetical protein ACOYB8_10720, partial [Eubacteriaceae bacterium]